MESRDIEKNYTKEEFISKLRRLADCIEKNENFRISVAGEAIYVPDRATFSIEHERSEGAHEIEFQIMWKD
jgi:amphi-Trp domain-containing protein